MMTYNYRLLTKPPIWRCRALATAILLLFLCLEPTKQGIDAGVAVANKPDVPAVLDLVWKKSVPVPAFITSSHDGKYVASVDKNGGIICLGPDGNTVWKASLPDVDRIVLGPDGSALGYSYLNILQTTVYLLGPNGKQRLKQSVSGAVWSADASKDPGVFALGTGDRYCYCYNMQKRGHHYKRWRIPGAPCSLSFTPDGKSILFGAWQEAGVSCYSLNGRKLFYCDGKGDRLYSINVASNADRVLVTSSPNRDLPEATLHLKDSSLNDLWSKEFPVRKLAADMSILGDCVAVGFERPMASKNKQAMENRIALYDDKGRMLWEKGGVFGKWELVEITNSGHVLVCDDSAYLYSLSRTGSILLRRKLPADIRLFAKVATKDKVVVYCSDGQLMLLNVR